MSSDAVHEGHTVDPSGGGWDCDNAGAVDTDVDEDGVAFGNAIRRTKADISTVVKSCWAADAADIDKYWGSRHTKLALQDELQSKDEQLQLVRLTAEKEKLDAAYAEKSGWDGVDTNWLDNLKVKQEAAEKTYHKTKMTHTFSEFKRKKTVCLGGKGRWVTARGIKEKTKQ